MGKHCLPILLLLIGILIFSACSKKTITFTGEASLYTSNEFHPKATEVVNFWCNTKNGLKEKPLSFKNGRYITIKTKVPVFLRSSGLILSSRIVYPGDTLTISQNEFGSYIYRVTNKKRNTDLYCAKLLDSLYAPIGRMAFKSLGNVDTLRSQPKNNIEEQIKKSVNISIQQERKLLDSLSANYSLSKDFQRHKQYEIQADSFKIAAWFYQDLLNPTEGKDSLLATCKNFIKGMENLSSKNGSFYYFRSYAGKLLDFIEKAYNIKRDLRNTQEFILHYNSINDYFTAAARDYLLSDLMYNALSKRIEVPSDYLNSYFKTCKNRNYKSEVRQKLKEKAAIEAIRPTTGQNDMLTIGTEKRTTIEDVISQEKGNIILLDFWASWCVPCREEFPHLKALETQYKGRKIKFIKISFDREVEKWKQASYTEGFADNNYVLLHVNKSAFIATHQVETIPRTMLIDANGEMITANAPAPGDSSLKVLIDKHLGN